MPFDGGLQNSPYVDQRGREQSIHPVTHGIIHKPLAPHVNSGEEVDQEPGESVIDVGDKRAALAEGYDHCGTPKMP